MLLDGCGSVSQFWVALVSRNLFVASLSTNDRIVSCTSQLFYAWRIWILSEKIWVSIIIAIVCVGLEPFRLFIDVFDSMAACLDAMRDGDILRCVCSPNWSVLTRYVYVVCYLELRSRFELHSQCKNVHIERQLYVPVRVS